MTATVATRTDTLLSIENVSLSYGDNVVLRDVNAKILDLVRPGCVTGQVVAFLGPSGVGKTSLLKIIAGLNKPTNGVVLLGKDRKPVRPGDVGLVSQDYMLYRNRDVLSNLTVAARFKENPKQAAVDILNEFGLLEKSHLYPSQLSGGQRQRISIAQQLLSAGDYLLMDEPTAGLDPLAKDKVCGLISEVANRSEASTVICVTHDIHSALLISDTVWLMGKQIGADGSLLPGSTIVRELDLISAGLTWHPELSGTSTFRDIEQEIISDFCKLSYGWCN